MSLLPRVLAHPGNGYAIEMRREWSDDLFDAVAADPDPGVRARLARARGASEDQRARLADDPRETVLTALLDEELPLPGHVFRHLAAHPSRAVRRMLTLVGTTPREVMALLAEDGDPEIAKLARRDLEPRPAPAPEPETLSRERAEAVVASESAWARSSVALDPDLPADLVAVLATDPSPEVRQAVSMRRELTEEQRAAIDYHVSTEDRLRPLDWVREAAGEELDRCVWSAHPGLRRSAAGNPRLTAEQIAVLAADDDFPVRLLLCERQTAVPADLVVRTYLEARVISRSELLRHPALAGADLTGYAGSPHWEARAIVVLDPAAPAELIDRLSRDEHPGVRAWMAVDDRLPVERVRELFEDPRIGSSVAANPKLPVELMMRILDDASSLPGPPPDAAIALGVHNPSHEAVEV